jgi:hypothetical protein
MMLGDKTLDYQKKVLEAEDRLTKMNLGQQDAIETALQVAFGR